MKKTVFSSIFSIDMDNTKLPTEIVLGLIMPITSFFLALPFIIPMFFIWFNWKNISFNIFSGAYFFMIFICWEWNCLRKSRPHSDSYKDYLANRSYISTVRMCTVGWIFISIYLGTHGIL